MLLNPGQDELLDHLFYGKPAKTGIGRRSSETAKERLLVNGDGKLYMPSRYVLAALVNAGKQVQHKGKMPLSTEQSSLVPGLLDLVETELVLTDHDGSEAKWHPTKFRCWTNSRAHHESLVVRPQFRRWRTVVRVQFNRGEIHEDKVRQLFELAGRSVGLGDFRVGQNARSRFGRFVVESWESAKASLELDAA